MFKKSKFTEFMKKNGFYICLALCVLGVGLAVFIGLGNEEGDTKDDNSESVQHVQPPQTEKPSPTPEAGATPSAAPEETDTMQETPAESEKPTIATTSTKISIQLPLDGEITKEFSGETLVYNSTLNMWMTHNGIDIASSSDTQVKAALAGEVAAVYTDENKGTIVEISHANGYKTIYTGLAEAGVEKGALVNPGTALGSVGTPAFESAQGPHLHFELLRNGNYVDPVEYLQK